MHHRLRPDSSTLAVECIHRRAMDRTTHGLRTSRRRQLVHGLAEVPGSVLPGPEHPVRRPGRASDRGPCRDDVAGHSVLRVDPGAVHRPGSCRGDVRRRRPAHKADRIRRPDSSSRLAFASRSRCRLHRLSRRQIARWESTCPRGENPCHASIRLVALSYCRRHCLLRGTGSAHSLALSPVAPRATRARIPRRAGPRGSVIYESFHGSDHLDPHIPPSGMAEIAYMLLAGSRGCAGFGGRANRLQRFGAY
jgi:hypothetical protein